MTLDLTQLKDLEYICQFAEERLVAEYRWLSSDKQQWLERIRTYRLVLQNAMAKELPVLITDPNRINAKPTGILVRALDIYEKPLVVDITQLTTESLFAWLRSRGGDNVWAENTVALLLGHEVLPE